MLYIVIIVYGSYADVSFDAYIPGRYMDYFIVKMALKGYNPPRPGGLNRDDIMFTGEYYYQLLLKEWLKDVTRQELTPVAFECKNCMSNLELLDSTGNILKKHYNVDTKKHYNELDRVRFEDFGGTTIYISMGSFNYPFWLLRAGEIRTVTTKGRYGYKRELVWILFSKTSRRAVWLKDDIDNKIWEKVKLSELRDNNVYTVFLRKMEWDNIKCPSLRPKKSVKNFPYGVDSVDALAIAVTATEKCYGAKMVPLGAKLMGNNKEHWLAYCFSTPPDSLTDTPHNAFELLAQRYEEGLSLWNIGRKTVLDLGYAGYFRSTGDIGYRSFLGRSRTTNEVVQWWSKVATVLISRETGQVLFME